MSSRLDRAAMAALVASVATFLASLACPAIHGSDTWSGYRVLAVGAAGLLVGHFGWLANPLILVVWGMVAAKGNTRVAAILGTLAIVLALSSIATLHARGVGFEGVSSPAIVLHGYWVWLASIVLSVLAAFLCTVAQGAEAARQREIEDERAIRELGDRRAG